uniref:SWIB domain-containing protein n=1 Tax=Steinernema glaseri TaxID=37863 RepID=A0A1I7YVE0_9BILA
MSSASQHVADKPKSVQKGTELNATLPCRVMKLLLGSLSAMKLAFGLLLMLAFLASLCEARESRSTGVKKCIVNWKRKVYHDGVSDMEKKLTPSQQQAITAYISRVVPRSGSELPSYINFCAKRMPMIFENV